MVSFMTRKPDSKAQLVAKRVTRSSLTSPMGSAMSHESRQAMPVRPLSRATAIEEATTAAAGARAPSADSQFVQQQKQLHQQQQKQPRQRKQQQPRQQMLKQSHQPKQQEKPATSNSQPHHDQLHGLKKYDYSTVYPLNARNRAWDPDTFAAAAAAAALSLGLPAHTNAHQLPGHRSSGSGGSSCSIQTAQQATDDACPRLVVLLLAHSVGVTAAEAWQAWEQLHGGKVVVRIHLKQGVSIAKLPNSDWISDRLLPTRVKSEWGDVSLTEAILRGAADVLQQYPGLQHIAVASGQDIPVSRLPPDLHPGLSLFGSFQFGLAFDAAAGQVAAYLLQQQLGWSLQEAQAWGNALTFHHTWMLLDR